MLSRLKSPHFREKPHKIGADPDPVSDEHPVTSESMMGYVLYSSKIYIYSGETIFCWGEACKATFDGNKRLERQEQRRSDTNSRSNQGPLATQEIFPVVALRPHLELVSPSFYVRAITARSRTGLKAHSKSDSIGKDPPEAYPYRWRESAGTPQRRGYVPAGRTPRHRPG